MLASLHVKNLAIIDEVEVEFSDHLNILTGETGAGKSIILGSINIAIGGKVSAEMIRSGAEYAFVELVFHVGEDSTVFKKMRQYDLPLEEDQIIISRKITKSRSSAKINGETVTIAVLKDISLDLIDIHGQHEHQSLLYKKEHLHILDQFSKKDLGILKEQLLLTLKEYRKLKGEIEKDRIPEEDRLREVSFLEYECNEIESAALKEGEDEQLLIQYRKLSNAATIAEGIGEIYRMTGGEYDSAGELLGRANRQFSKLFEYDETIQELGGSLLELENLLNDFNREVSEYLSGISCDTEELLHIEQRLDLLNHLKAKYGNSIQEIEIKYEKMQEKRNRYKDYEQYMQKMEEELQNTKEKVLSICKKISAIRMKKAKIIEKKIHDALEDLNFLDVQFKIQINETEHFTEEGKDEVNFLISTNPGEELQELGKVASGGELSRIMLAIKSVLAEQDSIDTLIFDEIDVGISGRTAQKVSEKMSYISRQHQVMCITHLPQIAAMADEHFVIEKQASSTATRTTIRKLQDKDSVIELARILGGAKITDTVLESAKEMKELAENSKMK